jgi:hypothetical protein
MHTGCSWENLKERDHERGEGRAGEARCRKEDNMRNRSYRNRM